MQDIFRINQLIYAKYGKNDVVVWIVSSVDRTHRLLDTEVSRRGAACERGTSAPPARGASFVLARDRIDLDKCIDVAQSHNQ